MIIKVGTLLDSVNRCLAAIGELPVSSLDENNVDIGNILNTIDAVSTTLQTNESKGWWFNTDYNVGYTPNATTGVVTLPNNHLAESIALDPTKHYNADHYMLVVRGQQIYNARASSYDLREIAGDDKLYLCSLVVKLPFEYLPQVAKDFITEASRATFALDFETDFKRVQALSTNVDKAFYAVQLAESRNRRHNYLNDNQSISNLIAHMQ